MKFELLLYVQKKLGTFLRLTTGMFKERNPAFLESLAVCYLTLSHPPHWILIYFRPVGWQGQLWTFFSFRSIPSRRVCNRSRASFMQEDLEEYIRVSGVSSLGVRLGVSKENMRFSVTIFDSSSSAAIFFSTYEAMKKSLPLPSHLAPVNHMLAASVAEVVRSSP